MVYNKPMNKPSPMLASTWRCLSTGQQQAFTMVALVALALLVRAPFARWPLIADEGVYAYTAHWWTSGYTLYSDDLWMDRPQGIFAAYRVGMWLLGESVVALRLWGALWAAGTVPLVYLIARRFYSERAAVLAGLICAVYSASPQIEGFTANAELFMVLPATASLYLLLRGRPGWAGLLAGLAVALKPSGVSTGLLALVLFWRSQAPRRAYVRFGLGALAVPVVMLAHGMATVGLAQYLYSILGSRFSIHRPWPLLMALSQLVLTLPAWLPLTATSLLGQRQAERPGMRLVGWWLLTSLPGMAMGGGWYRHYYVQLIPPLSVLAGAALDALLRARRRQRTGFAIAFLASIALTMGLYMVISPKEGAARIFEKSMVTYEDEVSAYLRERTTPHDTIYVAYEGAQICYLTGRRSASPYLFAIHVNYQPGVYDSIIALIEEQRPKYIATSVFRGALEDRDERLTVALHENYRLVETIDLVEIYRRRELERVPGRP